MYVEVHITSDKDNNNGSCKKYVSYLEKENDFFFSATEDKISAENAYQMIDEHSKGQLKKDEAKWYAPVYSFSEKESQAIVKKLFNKDLKDYEELNNKEKAIFKQELIKYAREFQNVMAENFDKKELGISTGKDLVYVGVVEFSRTYKGFDEEVIKGEKVSGEPKKGFNAHIHIIQSRKANNEKKSKISPMAKAKSNQSNFGGKNGFDRNNFKIKIENKLDEILNYNREENEKFLYYRENKIRKNIGKTKQILYKKGVEKQINIIKNNISEKINIEDKKENFIYQNEIKFFEKSLNLSDYFFELEKKNIVKFKGKNEESFIFEEVETSSEIIVSNDKWNNNSQYISGGFVKAIQIYENTSWVSAIRKLKSIFDEKNTMNKDEKQPKIEVLKYEKINKNYLLDYFLKENISKNIVKNNLMQITYKNPKTNKIITTTGLKNAEGGFLVKNRYFETSLNHSSFSLIKGNENLVIFHSLLEYLKYLQLKNIDTPKETIIILNEKKNMGKLYEELRQNNYKNISTTINDELFLKELLKCNDKAKYVSFNGKNVNEEFELQQIKDYIKKLKL